MRVKQGKRATGNLLRQFAMPRRTVDHVMLARIDDASDVKCAANAGTSASSAVRGHQR